MTNSARRWILLGLIALVVLAGIAFLVWRSQRYSVPFPEDSEVLRVTALLSGEGFSHETIPEFTIPSKYAPKLLAAFRPAWPQNYPPMYDEPTIGELKINLQDGKKVVVKFGFSGKNPLCYKFEGVRCIRGGQRKPIFVDPASEDYHYLAECVAVEQVIREIHQEVLTGERSPRLAEEFASLERSAGLHPPELIRP